MMNFSINTNVINGLQSCIHFFRAAINIYLFIYLFIYFNLLVRLKTLALPSQKPFIILSVLWIRIQPFISMRIRIRILGAKPIRAESGSWLDMTVTKSWNFYMINLLTVVHFWKAGNYFGKFRCCWMHFTVNKSQNNYEHTFFNEKQILLNYSRCLKGLLAEKTLFCSVLCKLSLLIFFFLYPGIVSLQWFYMIFRRFIQKGYYLKSVEIMYILKILWNYFWGHVTTFCKLFSQTDKKMVKLALKIKFGVVFGKPSLFVPKSWN